MRFTLVIFLLLFSGSCFSDAIRMGFGVGRGNVDVSSRFNGGDNYADDVSLSASAYLGYILNNNIVIDLVYGEMSDDIYFGVFEDIHLDTYEALLGYRFNFEKFYLEPKLGYAKWDFELEESDFLNSGSEQKIKESGSDPLVALVAGYRFTSVFGMSMSYKYLDFEYGNADSVHLGFDFEF